MTKNHIGIFIVIILSLYIKAYGQSNIQTYTIEPKRDTLFLDTLFALPGTIQLTDINGRTIDTSWYYINETEGFIKLTPKIKTRKIKLQLRSLPTNYTESKYLFKNNTDSIEKLNLIFPESNILKSQSQPPTWEINGLQKSGSISRGLSYGNNQDVSLQSAMNFQLAGPLSENVDILAAISDENIPVQPEGNTAELREFDKVYIRIFSENTALTAGDFDLKNQPSDFLKFNKKLQGAHIQTTQTFERNKNSSSSVKFSGAGALSKGKFSRYELPVVDGNQGPYKLYGTQNETFIIILAGSEKVYLDGKLLQRGQNFDYIIDYNLAEITFTTNVMVTNESRIIIEFEYSDQNYVRSALFSTAEYQDSSKKISLQIFSEQDAKNQHISYDFSEQQQQKLFDIGDSIHKALFSNIDSVPFDEDAVLYKMIDTMGYDSVFVFSSSPDSAFFTVSFSEVGQGNGNYIRSSANINGRIFQWIAPQNGFPQGNYAPVSVIITPKKRQMAVLSSSFSLNKNIQAFFELAASKKDVNTFSSKNDEDDHGFAWKSGVDAIFYLTKHKEKSWITRHKFIIEQVRKEFEPLEPFRSVEFERDWNLEENDFKGHWNTLSLSNTLAKSSEILLFHQTDVLPEKSKIAALRNQIRFKYDKEKTSMQYNGSILSNDYRKINGQFLKQDAVMSYRVFKNSLAGVKGKYEKNLSHFKAYSDSLSLVSFKFFEKGIFAEFSDSAKVSVNIEYFNRKDYYPEKNILTQKSDADNYHLHIKYQPNLTNTISLKTKYRRLKDVEDISIPKNKKENLLGRVEHSIILPRRLVNSFSALDLGSGTEAKKEFVYVRVADGQGTHTWIDYNDNNIKELSEFAVAAFQEKANYVKVFRQTDDFIPAQFFTLNTNLRINPYLTWKQKKGILKTISRFSNALSYQYYSKKYQHEDNSFFQSLLQRADSSLISFNRSLRNSFAFNRNAGNYSAEVIFHEAKGKYFYANGFEEQFQTERILKMRIKLTRELSFQPEISNGLKKLQSEFSEKNNHSIVSQKIAPRTIYQPSLFFRMSIQYLYGTQKDKLTKSLSNSNILRTQCTYQILKKANISGEFRYLLYNYNGEEDTPLAYEMMQGYQNGENYMWQISYLQNMTGYLQMNVNYTGRALPGIPVIHSGSIQMRAFF